MKSNEYVKLVGWEYAKLNASSCSHQYYFLHNGYAEVCVSELRLLVESYELIEQYNGLFEAKELIRVSPKLTSELRGLAAAIADVESCK